MTDRMIQEVVSKDDLKECFRNAGIKNGMTLEVHASMRRFGFVIGGAETVVDALMETVGYEGTIVMPIQCRGNQEPSSMSDPEIDPALWGQLRRQIPPFDPLASEITGMGPVAENFRRRQGVYFTRHPSCAFAAYGRNAKTICERQSLSYPLGENSPLARLVDCKALVLLLGAGYDSCTGMCLGEYLSGVKPIVLCGGAIDRGDGRRWVKYLDIEHDESVFPLIGKKMEEEGKVHITSLNKMEVRSFRLSEAVRFVRNYVYEQY